MSELPTCPVCGDPVGRGPMAVYCSYECRRIASKQRWRQRHPDLLRGQKQRYLARVHEGRSAELETRGTCVVCGASFEGFHRGQQYCSRGCAQLAQEQRWRACHEQVTWHICKSCGASFVGTYRDKICSSDACQKAREARREARCRYQSLMARPCRFCGALFVGSVLRETCAAESCLRGFEKTCCVCGATFKGYANQKVCSARCRKAQNKKIAQERNQKMQVAYRLMKEMGAMP